MMREEQVGEREGEKDEFLGIMLKRGVLVGRRGGNTTPSPVWRSGLSKPEDTQLQDFSFPSSLAPRISARKLAAELWEIQPQLKFDRMKKDRLRPHLHKLKNKGFDLSNQCDEPSDCPQDQPTAPSNMKKCTTELSQSHQLVEMNGHALETVSSPGSNGSMEMIPNRPVISPSYSPQFKGKFRQPSNNIKTSTELLRVLDRIWSLEEQHKCNVILADTMKKELDQARTMIKVLVKEKKRYHQETEDLMKQLADDKVARKDKEQYQVQEAIQSLKEELEAERKMRKHSESLHRKLGRELSEAKSCFSNAFKELERERKARMLLEDLCDEFAKGIRDYEQEMRALKHKSEKDFATIEPADRLILHFSEAWLDERMQMKLEEAGSGHLDKKTILDKLITEIETFLQARKSTPVQRKRVFSLKRTAKSARSSKESFHLNDAGSAPQNENDKEDSVDSDLCCGEIKRNPIPLQRTNSAKQRDHSLPSAYQKYHHGSKHTENLLDSSSFTGATSPVERWTSAPDLDASESSSRFPPGVKENTLKAKLLEARLESQQSRSRGP